MIKIQIKNRWTGLILFEYEKENNTIKKTVINAYLRSAYLGSAYLRCANLRDAYLRSAYLGSADLRGADLRGADLGNGKVKTFAVFTGIYTYIVVPYILENGEQRVKMGCYDRSVTEWDQDFWNNNDEFPNNNSVKTNLRLIAFETAKKWIELNK